MPEIGGKGEKEAAATSHVLLKDGPQTGRTTQAHTAFFFSPECQLEVVHFDTLAAQLSEICVHGAKNKFSLYVFIHMLYIACFNVSCVWGHSESKQPNFLFNACQYAHSKNMTVKVINYLYICLYLSIYLPIYKSIISFSN